MKKKYSEITESWIRVSIPVFLVAALLINTQKVSASTEFIMKDKVFLLNDELEGITSSLPFKIPGKKLLPDYKTESMIDRIIRGKVVDDKGESLPGVSVQLKETTVGTVTNVNGEYSLTIPADNGTLIFSFLGFTPVEIIIGLGSTINTTLQTEQSSLDEFVVVGYGTQKKIDVTGAVSSIQAKDLVMTTSPDIGRLLKGKLSGLLVIENSAQPGGGLNIQIRGAGSINASNDPLIVVDGFPISNLDIPANGGRYVSGSQSILNSFNPNDIESITVLKDASATSIYGSRAANGVILITTKPGTEGKPTIQYSATTAVQQYNDQYDVFNLKDWMAESNRTNLESWDHSNGVIPWGTKTRADAMAAPLNGLLPQYRYTQADIDAAGEGTDWVGLITQNGSIDQHNLSLSGGSRSSKYYFSGNYYANEGVIKNSDMKRYSFRMNLGQDLSQFVKLGINLTASRILNNNTQLGGGIYENSSLIKSAIDFSPATKAINEDGTYPLNPEQGLRPNPYSMLSITDQSQIERALINTNLDIIPLKNLTVRLKASVDRGVSKRSIYQPKVSYFGNLEQGIASIAANDNNSFLYEATANYVRTIAKDHNFTLLGGVSQQKFRNSSNSAGNTKFITDAFLWNSIGTGAGTRTLGSSLSDNLLLSYFTRLNYGYKDKYLLTFTVRKDGASVFAKNNKWATFPSMALGWNIDKESWFEGLKPAFTHLKFRVSYGKTGNASIGSNAFAAYRAYAAYLGADDQILTGVSLSRLENPDLKWETTTGANLGLDFSLLNDKVEGSVEFYQNVITDLLSFKALNSFNFINQVMANIGSTKSRGFEVSISTYNVSRKDFQWKTIFTASKFKDNWVKRQEGWIPAIYQTENDPIRARYSQQSQGIMQIGETKPVAQPLLEPGQIKIKDVDGYKRDAAGNPAVDANKRFILLGAPDGRIDDADTRLVGTRDPKLSAGFTNILTYKSFSLNFDFNGQFGREIADPNFASFGLSPSSVSNTLKTVLDRWTPTNPSKTHPSAFGSNYGSGDFYQRSAWFVRMQNVELGYDLPRKLLKNLAQNLRINVGASNLLKITPYSGIDPETDGYAAAYPNVKTFTFGLNATF